MDEIIEAGKKAVIALLNSAANATNGEEAASFAQASQFAMGSLTVAFHNADHEAEEAQAAKVKEFLN